MVSKEVILLNEYDYLIYIPGEAVAIKIVGTVSPSGKFTPITNKLKKSILKYIKKS
jgi:hypothetical protein